MTPCEKRRYPSVEAARKAHKHFSGRVRVYRCPECHAYIRQSIAESGVYADLWYHLCKTPDRLNAILAIVLGLGIYTLVGAVCYHLSGGSVWTVFVYVFGALVAGASFLVAVDE